VLANDSDPDGDTLTVEVVGGPAHGTVTLNADKTLTYSHSGDDAIEDSFTYRISDGHASDTATVRITINQPPDAVDDSASVQRGRSVDIDVVANDTDLNGDGLAVSGFTQGANGTVSQNADGSLKYTHSGSNTTSDSFTYTVTDRNSGFDTATVRITVTRLPDLEVTELQAVNNRPDDEDDDYDNDGRRDSEDGDDDNDGHGDDDDDDDDNDNRRDDRSRQGDKVTITATVANTGITRAGSSKTEFLVDGEAVALVDTGSIPADGQRKVSIVWNTRDETPGAHQIQATADRNGQVAESNESNNTRELTYTVQGNQVQNGSFEADGDGNGQPDGWSGESTGAGTASYSDGGSDGQKSVSTSGSGGNAAVAGSPTWTSAPIAVTPGTLMDLQLSALASGASSPASAGLVYLGPLGNALDGASLITTPFTTAPFAQLERAVTIPAGVANVRVVLTGFSPTDLATRGTVTFDDVGLFER
jgi:hypothetical protein